MHPIIKPCESRDPNTLNSSTLNPQPLNPPHYAQNPKPHPKTCAGEPCGRLQRASPAWWRGYPTRRGGLLSLPLLLLLLQLPLLLLPPRRRRLLLPQHGLFPRPARMRGAAAFAVAAAAPRAALGRSAGLWDYFLVLQKGAFRFCVGGFRVLCGLGFVFGFQVFCGFSEFRFVFNTTIKGFQVFEGLGFGAQFDLKEC